MTMNKQIESFIDELRSNKKLSMFDEASTKQAVVLKLLSFLGWNIFKLGQEIVKLVVPLKREVGRP